MNNNNKPKIIIDSGIPFIKEHLENFFETVYCPGHEIDAEKVKDCDALIVRTRTICNEHLLKGSGVKIVATATIGTDHIDSEWCAANGITVKSAPGCNAGGVAQYIFSSLFKLGFNPTEDTLGIIGYGNVGSLVGEWAKQMGIKVMVCDPPRKDNGETDVEYKDFKDVLKNCDAVTIHVPLTKDGNYPTKHLISHGELSLLKDNAILINSSRGGVVDEKSLKEFLRSGKIRAVTDVWENEPEIDRELLYLSSIATPHIAGYSKEGKIRATRMAIEAMEEYFNLSINKDNLYPSRENDKITKQMIENSYNPELDSTLLRNCPEDFENIRNNYSYRHEPGF